MNGATDRRQCLRACRVCVEARSNALGNYRFELGYDSEYVSDEAKAETNLPRIFHLTQRSTGARREAPAPQLTTSVQAEH